MTVHSFHLAEVPVHVGVRAVAGSGPDATGLDHAECL